MLTKPLDITRADLTAFAISSFFDITDPFNPLRIFDVAPVYFTNSLKNEWVHNKKTDNLAVTTDRALHSAPSESHSAVEVLSTTLTELTKAEKIDITQVMAGATYNFNIYAKAVAELMYHIKLKLHQNLNTIISPDSAASSTYFTGFEYDVGVSSVLWSTTATANPKADIAQLKQIFENRVGVNADHQMAWLVIDSTLIHKIEATTSFITWDSGLVYTDLRATNLYERVRAYLGVQNMLVLEAKDFSNNSIFTNVAMYCLIDRPTDSIIIDGNRQNRSSLLTAVYDLDNQISPLRVLGDNAEIQDLFAEFGGTLMKAWKEDQSQLVKSVVATMFASVHHTQNESVARLKNIVA